jgi:serine/threonine-protein kinase
MAYDPESQETVAVGSIPATTPRPKSRGEETRFEPGTLLARRYRIVSRLGKGGMGEVFRADDIVLGQPVALKFLPETAKNNVNFLTRFYDEVRIARQISHPNVCRVYDIGELNGHPYLSMEYIDGEDLASLLRRIGRLPGDKAAEFARKICAGVAAAHAQGVLHRDIKPGNIMIDGRGEPRVTDFGLAALASAVEGSEIRNGTPAYMAPEQLEGREVSAQSDIYAMGLVFHEMFTGKAPHEVTTLAELTKLRSESTTTNLSTLVSDLDPAADRAIRACLQPDPKLRPKSALDVARMLPGGDPLAMALAAGQTPSPEMVAASGTSGALKPKVGFGILAGTLLTLFGGLGLADYMAFTNKLPLQYPPQVLTARAREVIVELGYPEAAEDWAIGVLRDDGFVKFLQKNVHARAQWLDVVKRPPTYLAFWYRAGPQALRAENFSSQGRVSPEDPPSTIPGMTFVSLGLDGRMRKFTAVPPRTSDPPKDAIAVNWAKVFALAKLDYGAFHSAAPEWTPLVATDERVAWTGTYPTTYEQPIDIPIRVEAAAFHGRPVYFEIFGPWDEPVRSGAAKDIPWTQKASNVFILSLVAILMAGGCLLAWHQWKTGRADRSGAAKVGLYVATLGLIRWILEAHHHDMDIEVNRFAYMMGSSLFAFALFWIFYLALEPWVRRYWPRVLVTWTRILQTDWKNPQVGRDVLIGAALGVLFITWIAVMQLLVLRTVDRGPEGLYLPNLIGVNHVLGEFLGFLGGAIESLTGFLLLGLFLRVVLRKEWLVAIAFVLLLAFNQMRGADPPFWPSFGVNVGIYVILILALMRFGLFAGVVMLFVTNVLGDGLITTDFSAWYGTSSWIAIVIVTCVAIWGYRISTAGKSLFGEVASNP